MDAIADKILVNAVLIVLAVNGYISVVVPVVIVSRDIIVDSIKMVAGQKSGAVGASKTGKIKIKNEENQLILTTCDQIRKGNQLIIEATLIDDCTY